MVAHQYTYPPPATQQPRQARPALILRQSLPLRLDRILAATDAPGPLLGTCDLAVALAALPGDLASQPLAVEARLLLPPLTGAGGLVARGSGQLTLKPGDRVADLRISLAFRAQGRPWTLVVAVAPSQQAVRDGKAPAQVALHAGASHDAPVVARAMAALPMAKILADMAEPLLPPPPPPRGSLLRVLARRLLQGPVRARAQQLA